MYLPAVWVLLCKTWHISSFLGFLDFFLEITDDGTLEICCWGGCCCCPTVTRLLAVPETGAKWTTEFVCSDGGCSTTWGMINDPFLPIF